MITDKNIIDDRATALRRWAKGSTTMEAAVELLATALNGRLLDGPWVVSAGDYGPWFDPRTAASELGYLSGGERRVLAIATSLVSVDHPVDLGDAVAGIDPASFVAVVQALGHAYGLSSDGVEGGEL